MSVQGHVVRCFVGGIVAILPIGGTILAVVYAENLVRDSLFAGSQSYFPGLGLLSVLAIVYVVGLFVTTVLGRWLWRMFDSVLDHLPALGQLYKTLKQILGYGKGKDALFTGVVMVPCRDVGGEQIGLLTSEWMDRHGTEQCTVFVPGTPNPTAGRLVVMPRDGVRSIDMEVHDAVKALVSIGKTEISVQIEPGSAPGPA